MIADCVHFLSSSCRYIISRQLFASCSQNKSVLFANSWWQAIFLWYCHNPVKIRHCLKSPYPWYLKTLTAWRYDRGVSYKRDEETNTSIGTMNTESRQTTSYWWEIITYHLIRSSNDSHTKCALVKHQFHHGLSFTQLTQSVTNASLHSVVQRHAAVTAYLKSKQLLLLAFVLLWHVRRGLRGALTTEHLLMV